jgi:hypothetical protein
VALRVLSFDHISDEMHGLIQTASPVGWRALGRTKRGASPMSRLPRDSVYR